MDHLYRVLFTTFLLLIFVSTNEAIRRGDVSTRIIGGQAAFAGQFPFAAAIRIETSDSRIFCGGTLTANQWIITSGHCVNNAVQFTIQLGLILLDSNEPGSVVASTSTYIIHPDFNPLTIENDLGLIKLRESLTYDVYLMPIHPLQGELLDNANVYVLGWGSTSDSTSELSPELHYVHINTITNNECRIFYGNQINDNMICVVGNYNEGICNGDNGGALAVQNGRTYDLVGVASFVSGNGCESTEPSGYTRVTPYYDWITNYTQQADF